MMQTLKAHVHNGRLVLDEPTDLPEGQVVELLRADEVFDDDDEGLKESLRESIEQMKAGDLIDGAKALAEIQIGRASCRERV